MSDTVEFSTSGLAPLTATTSRGLVKELREEESHWSELLDHFMRSPTVNRIWRQPRNREILKRIVNLSGEAVNELKPEDIDSEGYKFILPQRNSAIGIALREIFETGDIETASDFVGAYFIESGWVKGDNIPEVFAHRRVPSSSVSAARGFGILKSMQLIEKYAPTRISAQKLTAEVAAVRKKIDDIDLEIEQAEVLRSGLEEQAEQTHRRQQLETEHHKKRYLDWRKAIREKNASEMKKQGAEFDDLRAKFVEQLKYKAPVKLWSDRAQEHRKRSRDGLVAFVTLLLTTVVGAGSLALFGGDFISSAFVEYRCAPETNDDCSYVFSPRGVFLTSTILLITSLALWGMRLQSKVYLSERHLALDAEEKKAFAETYLALRMDDSVGSDSEAIVLSSLFRPTQDGIIKDDEGTLDLSAAAIIAKTLQRQSN